MSTIQFAKNRFAWGSVINNSLRKGAKHLLDLQLQEITKEHHRQTGVMAFTSNGMGYHANPLYVFTLQFKPAGLKVAPLAASQEPAFASWLADYEQWEHQAQRLTQQLLTVIGKAENIQDVRDMLPDHAYRVFPQDHPINLLPRSRPDLYACGLEGAGQHWDQSLVAKYAAISSLVDTYIGYSLL